MANNCFKNHLTCISFPDTILPTTRNAGIRIEVSSTFKCFKMKFIMPASIITCIFSLLPSVKYDKAQQVLAI